MRLSLPNLINLSAVPGLRVGGDRVQMLFMEEVSE